MGWVSEVGAGLVVVSSALGIGHGRWSLHLLPLQLIAIWICIDCSVLKTTALIQLDFFIKAFLPSSFLIKYFIVLFVSQSADYPEESERIVNLLRDDFFTYVFFLSILTFPIAVSQLVSRVSKYTVFQKFSQFFFFTVNFCDHKPIFRIYQQNYSTRNKQLQLSVVLTNRILLCSCLSLNQQ